MALRIAYIYLQLHDEYVRLLLGCDDMVIAMLILSSRKIIFILLDGARWEILPLSLRQTMILHQIVVLTYQQLLAKDFLVHYLWFVGLLQILCELLLNIVCRRGLLLYNEHCRIHLISCNQWVNQIQVCKGQRSSDGVLFDQCDPWQDLGFSCKDMVVLHCPVLFVVQYL